MLDDKYRIERLLATGGMGAVYLGTHVGLRKRVAIKVLNPQLNSAPMIERFHREAITASQIGHEGIAQVTDLGTSGEGEPFLVMEFLEGESLASRLKASGPLAIEEACELGCAILSPLAAAHRAGIVHRDLKPDNVFLVRQSRGEMVKLLDFGISRVAGQDSSFRLTTTGLILGTPYYMSPEQARGDSEVTVAADLYSFGVILYEMLVGVVPIRAENYNQLMYRVMTGEFAWPRQLRPDLPDPLERIIVRAMALEPASRPSSANELEQALWPFCRQVFRDAATGRLSAPGLLFRASGIRPDGLMPPTAPGRPGAGDPRAPLVTARDTHPPWPHATGPGSSAVSGVASASSAIAPRAPAAPRRSRTAIVLVGLVVAIAAAVVIAFAIGNQGATPTATPPTTAMATPPPAGATASPTPAPQHGSEPPAPVPQQGSEPPAPAPQPTPRTQEPAAPATITLRLQIEPADATVTLDDKPVSSTELVVVRDAATHHVRITAAGYLPDDETVSFTESQRLVVQLKRAATPGRRTHKDRPSERPEKPEKIESHSPYEPHD
jgi:serine/threonine protein kinase